MIEARRRTWMVTVSLGERTWPYMNADVEIDGEHGLVHIYQGSRLLASAPIGAVVIEWIDPQQELRQD